MRWVKLGMCCGVLGVICAAIYLFEGRFVCVCGDRISVMRNIESIEYRNGLVRERIYIFEPEPVDLNSAHVEIEMLAGSSNYNVITGVIDASVYYRAWISVNDLLEREGAKCEDEPSCHDMFKIRVADRCYWLRTGTSANMRDEALMTKTATILSCAISGMKTNSMNIGLHYSLPRLVIPTLRESRSPIIAP
jgi:hypothetical protein